ncbi:SRPBCC family protein [Solirubrobacter soli]|uniref:SRPBCC family protein n=1 Tax=Solirubrobacter soli TaxID=363832 RepID=UPI0004173D04|nr:SRPBCC domain-containing protein [Solirubrobacter soli]
MGEIDIRRVYAASPQRVWDAWTQPDQLAKWWGKRGWNAIPESIVLDVKPGGTFRVTTVDESGEQMTNEGTYSEVDEPHRLTFGPTTVTFTDLGDGRTEIHLTTTNEATGELFRRMNAGIQSAFERLEEALR